MIINVTQDHIDRGVRGGSASCCAVALAITEALRAHVTLVAGQLVDVYMEKLRPDRCVAVRRFRCPREVQEWYWRFDNGHHVEPMSFELEELS